MFILFQVVLVLSLIVATAIAQRPLPPAFARSGAGRGATAQLELEPQQPVPQPFRRVSLPLYRGRGFSLQDGQEPKSIPAITQLPPFNYQVDNNNNNNNGMNRVGNGDDDTATDALPLQPVRLSQVSHQQAERTQQIQQFDRIQQQPEKQYNSFRPQVCK